MFKYDYVIMRFLISSYINNYQKDISENGFLLKIWKFSWNWPFACSLKCLNFIQIHFQTVCRRQQDNLWFSKYWYDFYNFRNCLNRMLQRLTMVWNIFSYDQLIYWRIKSAIYIPSINVEWGIIKYYGLSWC